MMPEESLCFIVANSALGNHPGAKVSITEEQWMWHLVQHMRGVRHRHLCDPPTPVTWIADLAGHSVMRIALNNEYQPLREDEAQLYERLLVDSLHGNLDAVTGSFDGVKKLREPYLDPLQPVAMVGAFKGHLSVVRFALDRRAELDRDLALAVKRGSEKTSEMATLYEENKESLDDKIKIRRDPAKAWELRFPGWTIDEMDSLRHGGPLIKK